MLIKKVYLIFIMALILITTGCNKDPIDTPKDPKLVEYENFINYFNKKNQNHNKNEMTEIFKNKNVVVIQLENFEQFLINLKIDDKEVTPNINLLANTGYYFSNMYSQHSLGYSSDTEFTISTSLLPKKNDIISLTHYNNTYITTANLLREKGYTTLLLHANEGKTWNRNIMYETLGYDVFFDKEQFIVNDEDLQGLDDYQFLQQTVRHLENISRPFLVSLITQTNISPWNEVDIIDENDVFNCSIELKDTTLCNYLKSVNYLDKAIGNFFEEIKMKNLLDDTIFILYGNHPANLPINDMRLLNGSEISLTEYKVNKRVPLIIWNRCIENPIKVDTVMGMSDANATINNMLGINNQFSIGNDIFSIEKNIVPFVNNDWTDGDIYYDSFLNEVYVINKNINKESITENYILERANIVKDIINISNNINKSDLIKYHYDINNK